MDKNVKKQIEDKIKKCFHSKEPDRFGELIPDFDELKDVILMLLKAIDSAKND